MTLRLHRRDFLRLAGASAIGTWACQKAAPGSGPALSTEWPEKAADLVMLTDRPPNLEMPPKYLVHDLTPNEAMFVRWHVSGIPTRVDPATFRLKVDGHVEREVLFSLTDLKRAFSPVSVVAVNQCSGNSRKLFEPRVPGVQWSGGAVGNAKWTGVRLKDVLESVGIRSGAASVSFQGLDRPPLASVPEFVKALDADRAMDPDILIAWGMNDAPLPMLNGFPLRLVVPGWYSTYWIKALEHISVLPAQFDGYWMAKAYRIPRTEGALESPTALAPDTVPISRMNVRSLFAHPLGGETMRQGAREQVQGVAFDGGTGIARVELSFDGGSTWTGADLGPDLGRYSFRRWRATWTPTAVGPTTLLVRATSRGGETQRPSPTWNRGGYMKNDPERVEVSVV